MIQLIKEKLGLVARFGTGTVKVKIYTLKTRLGGQVELTQCLPTPIGEEPAEGSLVEGRKKIVLDFASVESLDVVIDKLEQLREEMVSDYGLEKNA